MAKSISTILNQKSWSSRDVGEAVLYSMVNDVSNRGKSDYTPLLSQEQIDAMYKSLSESERAAVAPYSLLFNSVVEVSNVINGSVHQARSGCYRMLTRLLLIRQAETIKRCLDGFPEIITEEELQKGGEDSLPDFAAVLTEKAKSARPDLLDERGGFINPKEKVLAELRGLDPDDQKAYKMAKAEFEDLSSGMRILEAYNAVIEIFARIYRMSDLKKIKKNFSEISGVFDHLNENAEAISLELDGPPELLKAKRKAFAELFPRIEPDEFKPSEKKIAWLEKNLKDPEQYDKPYKLLLAVLNLAFDGGAE